MKLLDFEQLDPEAVDEILEADRIAQEKEEMDDLAQRYESRFEPKSWLEANVRRRKKAQIITILCHVVSGAGAAYAFYMLLDILTLGWLAIGAAILIIVLHEREKRAWSDRFWDFFYSHKRKINWKALAINATLFLISLGLTVGGAYFGVKENMPGSEDMGFSANPKVISLRAELKEAKEEKAAFEANPSNYTGGKVGGQIYYKRLDAWNDIDTRITTLRGKLMAMGDLGEGVMAKTKEGADPEDPIAAFQREWLQKRLFLCFMGILICLVAEIVFEWNMAFRSKFDYRIYLARKAMYQKKASTLPRHQNGHAKKDPALV